MDRRIEDGEERSPSSPAPSLSAAVGVPPDHELRGLWGRQQVELEQAWQDPALLLQLPPSSSVTAPKQTQPSDL